MSSICLKTHAIAAPVAPLIVSEHEHVEGAVHGLDLVLLLLHLHRVEHGLLVELVVTRGLPQLHVSNVWREHNLVPACMLRQVLENVSVCMSVWI